MGRRKPLKNCKKCGSPITGRVKSHSLYCLECLGEVDKEHKRNYWRRSRTKEKLFTAGLIIENKNEVDTNGTNRNTATGKRP